MKRVGLLGGALLVGLATFGCVVPEGSRLLLSDPAGQPQYLMKAWDRNSHEKLGEWYVYRTILGDLRTVDNDADIQLGQATIILEEVRPPANRIVTRVRSEDDR